MVGPPAAFPEAGRMSPMRVLVTGFEPFGGETTNASGAVVARLAESWDDEAIDLKTAVLPVEFEGGPEALVAAVTRLAPDVVLCLGEAGGRAVVTPERWAASLVDARIPDNAGAQPRAERLDDGPDRLPSGLDVDALVEAVAAVGVSAEVSEDAGSFVCNAVFRAAVSQLDVPAGFVHVPALRPVGDARVGGETDARGPLPAPEMSEDDLDRAVAALVRTAAAQVG